MRSITSVLLVTVAFGAVAAAPYFAFRDDSFARLIDHQTQAQPQLQISYDDQIDDLRAQIARMSRLDQERVEEIKSLRQRQETLEQVTLGLAKDRLIQATQTRNDLPASGTESALALSSNKTPSEIPNVETRKQAEKTTTSDSKKVRLPPRRHAAVVNKRTQEAPAVAADRNAIEPVSPVSQQNY